MFSERVERILGPAAVVIGVLVVAGLIGLIALRGSAPDQDLAAARDRLDPGDRARVAGTVGDIVVLPGGVTAFTLSDDSTRSHPLLVLSRDPASRNAGGRRVNVRGTLQRFEPAVLAARYHADLSDARLAPFTGEEVVVADSLGAKSASNDRGRS